MASQLMRSEKFSLEFNNNQPVKVYSLNGNNLKIFSDRNKISELMQIRANLLRQIKEKSAIILVTSDLKKAGVSTIALNLSAILAGTPEEKILLVDNNIENPTLTRDFGVENSPGIYNAMGNKSELKNTIKKTSINNLYFMGIGDQKNAKASIGRSFEIDSIFKELTKHFKWTIIDCQPIESNLETLYLAEKAKNILMVLESETSRKETIQNSKQKFENIGARVVGAVLNKRRFYIPSWLYKKV